MFGLATERQVNKAFRMLAALSKASEISTKFLGETLAATLWKAENLEALAFGKITQEEYAETVKKFDSLMNEIESDQTRLVAKFKIEFRDVL